MRGSTAKRLRVYANHLKNTDKQYKDLSLKTIHRRLKRLWYKDLEFKSYIIAKVINNTAGNSVLV